MKISKIKPAKSFSQMTDDEIGAHFAASPFMQRKNEKAREILKTSPIQNGLNKK